MSPDQDRTPTLSAMLACWKLDYDTAEIARLLKQPESHVANCLAKHFDQRHRDKQGRASA